MEFVSAPVDVKATTITVPEVLTTTTASKELAIGLTPAQVELAPISVDTTHTIMERGSESAQVGLSPAMDIVEELAHQMVQQFFASMKSCIKLVLSGKVPLSLPGFFLRIKLGTSITLEARSKLGHI